MSKKTKFEFNGFANCEDGKIAYLRIAEGEPVPVNVFIDNADEVTPEEGKCCLVEVYGIGEKISVFDSEESRRASGNHMASISLIPIGVNEGSNDILFSGKVLNVDFDEEAEPGDPNYCLEVETLDMIVTLYMRYTGRIDVGYIVTGVAWLFGNMEVTSDEN